MNFFSELMRAVLPGASAWRLGTSRSAEVTGGTPIARLYIATTGGTMYMGMGDKDIYIPYHYVGGGIGVGVSAIPTPVSGSFATTDFPSTGGEWGRVYLPPSALARVDMTRDTIAGPAVLINPGVQWIVAGAGFSVVVFGATIASLNFMNPISLFNQTKGVVFQAGLSATLGLGVSCTVHQLGIMQGSGMVNMSAAAPSASSRGFAKHLR